MHCKTYITVQVIDFPSLDDITRVGQAGPVVQHGSVVEIVDLFLALLGQLNIKHVYREVELGLGLFKVLLVEIVTSNLNSVRSQHNQWIILDTEGSDVVAHLLAVTCFVLILEKKRHSEFHLLQSDKWLKFTCEFNFTKYACISVFK